MEQGPTPPIEAYVLGAAVHARFVIHQGLFISLPVYQVLRPAELQTPPEFDWHYLSLQERKMSTSICGLNFRQQDTSVSHPPATLGLRGM